MLPSTPIHQPIPIHQLQPVRRRLALALVALAALVASPAAAPAAEPQAPPPPQAAAPQPGGENGEATEEVFFDTLAVNVVNVDVIVTDKQGQPVHDLTRDVFELLEDGRPVEIVNFYAVRDRRTAPAVDRLAVPGREVASLPPADPLARQEVPPEQRLHLIVYVDNLFLRPFQRNSVNREVARFLQFNTEPGDQVMVVSFERTLRVRQHFTGDVRLAQRALEEMETANALGQQQLAERRAVIERIETARSIGEAQTHADFFAKSLHNDAENSIRALKELVGSLGGLPGRKALLYVSEGVPMAAGEELFALVDLRHGRQASSQLMANRYGLRRDFRELVAKANANRVTFYALDAGGSGSHSSLSAEYGRSDGSYVEVAFVEDANRQEPLMALAEGTGGRAILNTNNFAGGLEGVASDLDTYYSLGYAPPNPGDGRYHQIDVRVKRKGLTARHRQGYRDKTAESRMDDGTLAALLYGASTNPLGVEVRLGKAIAGDRGNYRVPVEVRIPLGRVALLPQGDQHHGRLRVSVAVMDDDGETSTPSQQPFPVSVPSDELAAAQQTFYTYSAELLMRPGQHQVAVGVSDELGGETTFLRRAVRVGTSG